MSAVTVRPLPGAATRTEPGNYFISNYPPFSFWASEGIDDARTAFGHAPAPGTPLGLYTHIPFCRKRCHFCYFKVYTDKNSSAIQRYLDALVAEAHLYAKQDFVRDRPLDYVYFGGGTPSYLSTEQLKRLVGGLREAFDWSGIEEFAFECEPGTLTESKVHTLRELGVTRLSLGVENFDDHVLETNGRAHLSQQIFTAARWAREAGFPQLAMDLIAGMLEETPENWSANIDRILELAPDSVTIYQMEIPFNTGIVRQMRDQGRLAAPLADWDSKRAWVKDAFERFEAAGYSVTSAYTVSRDPARMRFVYRDALWHGADMIGLGVASFGHVDRTHYQNLKDLESYTEAVEDGRLPLQRAMALSPDEALVREMILQLKLGRLDAGYFRDKFGVEILERFADGFERYRDAGFLRVDGDAITLERDALLQVDAMLPSFYLPEHRDARYT